MVRTDAFTNLLTKATTLIGLMAGLTLYALLKINCTMTT